MMAFTSAVEPLRSANRMSGRTLYEWRIISPDGQPVAASNGIEVVPHKAMSEIERERILVVVTGIDVQRRSEEHTSELQSLMRISYAVFCLKKKKIQERRYNN